jgi:RNA polymerase sigma factor (sigma-70 family)
VEDALFAAVIDRATWLAAKFSDLPPQACAEVGSTVAQRLVEHDHQADPIRDLMAWTRRCARTKTIDRVRRRQTRQRNEDRLTRSYRETTDPWGAVNRRLDAEPLLASLRHAFAQLPKDQQAASLGRADDVPYREIGLQLGINKRKAQSTWDKARKRLLQLLDTSDGGRR